MISFCLFRFPFFISPVTVSWQTEETLGFCDTDLTGAPANGSEHRL